VPPGKRIALDLEMLVAPAYVHDFHAVMAHYLYRVWVYGSASVVFGNPACEGYWVADYAGKGPFMYAHSMVVATQWTDGAEYDQSEVTAYKPARFW